MYFNYGYERRLFEQDQAKKRREYRAAGMSEEAIKEMYKYDLYVFNNNRKEIKHRAHYSEMLTYDAETGDAHYMDMDEFESKTSLYLPDLFDWVEEIKSKQLYLTIKRFSPSYQLILSLLIKGYLRRDIAMMLGVSESTLSEKIMRIQKKIKKFL